MGKLNECEIAQAYEGKSINTERLLKLFDENGKHNGNDNYIARCERFDSEELALFNITPALTEYWGYYGIEFWIYLNIDNNKVYNCALSKFRYTGGYHGRPSGHGLTPTQQEFRIFRRIMDYITT
jgi:hypothetical protein